MKLKNFYLTHKKVSIFCMLFLLFALFYAEADKTFQSRSEGLVTGAILAKNVGISPEIRGKVYGLGHFLTY